MRLPRGRQPKVGRAIEVTLSDYDRRRVDQFCQIMKVGYSEFFHILLAGALEMAKESSENDRPLEAAR
jgi:hypothetical protein